MRISTLKGCSVIQTGAATQAKAPLPLDFALPMVSTPAGRLAMGITVFQRPLNTKHQTPNAERRTPNAACSGEVVKRRKTLRQRPSLCVHQPQARLCLHHANACDRRTAGLRRSSYLGAAPGRGSRKRCKSNC